MSNLVSVAAGETTEPVLDWFDISMRLRPIEQMSSKIAIVAGDSDAELKQLLAEKLPRIPYQLWNSKSQAALEPARSIALPSNCWAVGLMSTQNGSADSGNT